MQENINPRDSRRMRPSQTNRIHSPEMLINSKYKQFLKVTSECDDLQGLKDNRQYASQESLERKFHRKGTTTERGLYSVSILPPSEGKRTKKRIL